jgi:hypothetical protein
MYDFTNKELRHVYELGKLADYIDNNYYNIPTPEENKPDEFEKFKTCFEHFMTIFEEFHNAGEYVFKGKRTIEMDNLYTKLLTNRLLLQSQDYFWEHINDWHYIQGNNAEIDYIINYYIEHVLRMDNAYAPHG